jgi:hypothetical protein
MNHTEEYIKISKYYYEENIRLEKLKKKAEDQLNNICDDIIILKINEKREYRKLEDNNKLYINK